MKLFRFIIASILGAVLSSSMLAQSAADLYKSKCQGCHGADGKATAIGKKMGAKDFSDPEIAAKPEADLIKVAADGKNKMPAYKGKLKDDEIKELAKYIKQLK